VNKKIIATMIVLGLLIVGIFMLASNPVISCKTEVSENYLEAVVSQAKGVYSDSLPLLPVYVTVDQFESEKVYYTIHYFPFGTVEMSYIETDGYNIEKPLNGS